MNFPLVIIIILIVLILACVMRQSIRVQYGGEYVYYYMLGPENSQRQAPLGYMTETTYVAPANDLAVTRHTTPSRTHSHNKVHTDGRDDRHQSQDYYLYQDHYDWKPYDWRPFEWAPFWETRCHCPHCDHHQRATKNCIGMGTSDYQSCLDQQKN